MSTKPRFVIFAHNATYDKLHQVATIGLTAAAMGKDVVVVLLFDFTNGFNDSAPVVAAVISSGAMTPRKALLAAATFEFIGAYFLGTAVAKMIGTGIIVPGK